jgi:crotonobetainyl-CoA:carnitine CoA-transferase CaiB-like acyl-CoA transferase
MNGALAGIRIVECGDGVAAAYATKLLADLGAEVIKVEPRAGDSSRRRGPFPRGIADPDRSGLFLYLNTNKRAAAFDLESDGGRTLLGRLAQQADLLVHDLPPRRMAEYGLTYDELAAANPRLVMTSITPFGLDGPHRDYAATDMTLWNAGGIAYLNGSPEAEDLPPLRTYGHQAAYQGGLNAAIAALGALFGRLRSERGQHVVVSIQETLVSILELTFEYWPYMGLVASRLGRKPIQPLDFLECRDGWVFVCCVEEHQWKAFVELMGNPEWADLDIFANRLDRGRNWDALKLFLQEWARDQSVAELYENAQRRRIPFAPVSTMGDLLASDHLKARGFFALIDQPGIDEPLKVPGAPYLFSRTPWSIRRPAPRLGEHNDEILGELGLSTAEITKLRGAHVV